MVLEVVCGVSCCSVSEKRMFWRKFMVLERMDPIIPIGFIAHLAFKSLWGICLKRSNAISSEKVTPKVLLTDIMFQGSIKYNCTGLFTSPSGISELDCATTKTDTAERSISIGRESLRVFFVLGALAYFQVPLLGGSREEKWRSQ